MSSADLESPVAKRTIALIQDQHGSLADLPQELVHVIWVTTYRACEISMEIERGGGAHALTKSMLVGGGTDAREFDRRTRQLGFLKQIVPSIKAGTLRERQADTQLVVDMLKWNMPATEMSGIRRLLARKFAKADAMYNQPIPACLLV